MTPRAHAVDSNELGDLAQQNSEQALQELVDECQRLGLYDLTDPVITQPITSRVASPATSTLTGT